MNLFLVVCVGRRRFGSGLWMKVVDLRVNCMEMMVVCLGIGLLRIENNNRFISGNLMNNILDVII